MYAVLGELNETRNHARPKHGVEEDGNRRKRSAKMKQGLTAVAAPEARIGNNEPDAAKRGNVHQLVRRFRYRRARDARNKPREQLFVQTANDCCRPRFDCANALVFRLSGMSNSARQ